MSLFTRLKSLFNWSAAAPAVIRKPAVLTSTRRPLPSTEERVPERAGGPSARFFFLPYPDSPYSDTPEIKAAMRLMLRDPYVKSAWLSNVLTVAAQDFQCHASDDNDPLAKQQADFVRRCFDNMDGGMVGAVTSILNPLGADGYSVCEKVWKYGTAGVDKGRVTLRRLKPKRPDRIRLHGDEFNNVTGVRSVLTQEAWPISDFVYTRYLPVYDEADGIAPFRAAYAAYWMHDTVRKLRVIHHEKKIGGMLIGTYTDPNDQAGLEDALSRAKSATWMAVPEGVRVQAQQISTASDSEYAEFVADCRTDMVTGITFASLQILEGQTPDARGDSKVQKAISDLAPWYLTFQVTEAINKQLVPDLIDYNFPRVPVEYPKVSFGAVSNQELTQLCDLLSRAQQLGLKPSKKYYARVLTIQEADPLDPADAMAPPGQGMGMGGLGGMMGGMPGMGQASPPSGGAGDPFAQPPVSDPSGMDPMAQDGQPEGLFSEPHAGRWVEVVGFSWQQGKRGGRYWLPAGKQDTAANRLYGAKGEAAAKAAQEAPPDPKGSGATSSGRPDQQPAPPAPAPQQALADAVAERIRAGQPLTAKQLFEAANKLYGGTRAGGTYGPSQAYDALEAGLNAALQGKTDPTLDTPAAVEQAKKIAATVAALPTQTNRSGNKDAFQQFSTPAQLAFAVTWLANLKPTDTVLEPSAGTGSLAVHAQNAGATVYGNELDPARAALLKKLLGDGHVTEENAEQIGAILRGKVSPTVVVMNPPFSATAGRLGDQKDLLTATRHIDEALALLPEGGRLVALVGEGMVPPGSDIQRGRGKLTGSRYAGWFGRIQSEYSLRANVGVPGAEYAKMGTAFGTRVLVIDKTKGGGPPVTGDAADVPGLMEMLADVRNTRPESAGGGAPAAGAKTPAGRGAGRAGAAGGQAQPVPAAGRAGDAGAGLGVGDGGPGAVGGAGAGGGRQPRGSGGKPGVQPVRAVPGLRPAAPVTVQEAPPPPATEAGTQADLTDSAYSTWTPSVVVPGGQPLPAHIVESAAMGAVPRPKVAYRPHLSPDVIDKGMLSETAIETLVYAGAAHSQMLPGSVVRDPRSGASVETAPRRRGYFIGDGTGVGKGRQIAGIMTDNANQGRPKHVWVSKTWDLFEDAQRDWQALGQDPKAMVRFDKMQDAAEKPAAGVAYITYGTLKSRPKDPAKPSNLDDLVKWLGPDYDGVIAFDEAHMMGNATTTKGPMGEKKASQTALAGLDLQRRLPNARVVYVSATGATELGNLAYADRLGLWGGGTAFPTRDHFMNELGKGGVAAMEAVAQSMKATGLYSARTLSLGSDLPPGDPQQVKYDRLAHTLTPDQHAQYDAAADAWQAVLQNIDKALESSGGGESAMAKAAAKSAFWGAQQRFFNQVMTSMQTPTVITEMEKDIKEGRAPVVQLVNTSEAATDRAITGKEDDQTYDDLDVSPRKILMEYLEKSFPVHRYEEYQDEEGNRQHRLVTDSNGVPVVDPAAAAMRDELLDKVGTLRIPEGPLDMIVNHFGPDVVGEATGRRQRLVLKSPPNGGPPRRVLEPRNPRVANLAEADDFQQGRKKALIFSDAGATGRSYHAARTAANQQQRVHYMLQPGWRADTAVQGLGRTHRTDQASAPLYRLVQIDQLKGQKRFVSTIARRLDQLGAITKGQRQTGSGGLFGAADNLESKEAKQAMERFFVDLQGGAIKTLPYRETMQKLGFKIPEDDPKAKKRDVDTPPVTQFLNRLLSLRVSDQAVVFDEFERRLTEAAEAAVRNGTVDVGVENYPADRIAPKKVRTIYRDPDTGAEVTLHTITATRKTKKVPFDPKQAPVGYFVNDNSGRIWAAAPALDHTDPRSGQVTKRYRLLGPNGADQLVPHYQVNPPSGYRSNWRPLADPEEARKLWQEQFDATPETSTNEEHVLSGALLKVWDRLPKEDQPRIYRVKPDGQRAVVGRAIPTGKLAALLKDFGIKEDGDEAVAYKPDEVHQRVLAGSRAQLTGGWGLKKVRVQNEPRIELTGVGPYDMRQVEAAGAIRERIGYDTRFFVPTTPAGAEVLKKIAAWRPVTSVFDTDSFGEPGGTRATTPRQSPLPVAVLAAIRGRPHARSRS